MNINEITKELSTIFGEIKKPKSKLRSRASFVYKGMIITIAHNNPLTDKRRLKIGFGFKDLVLACKDEVGRNDYCISEEELFQLSLVQDIPISYDQIQSVLELYKKLGNVKFIVNLYCKEDMQ